MFSQIHNIRPLILGFLLLFFYSVTNAQADVTFLDLSSTIPQGPNRLALYQVCHFGTIDSILYNGKKMTLIKRQSNTSIKIDIWASLLGSGPEINTFPIIKGDASPFSENMISFANVDQDSAFGHILGSTSFDLNVNAEAGDMIWEGFARKDGNSLAGDSGQTELFDRPFNSSSSRAWGGYKQATAGSNLMSLDLFNPTQGAHVALAIRKASNDECIDAIPLVVESSSNCIGYIASNAGATRSDSLDTSIPSPNCASYQGSDIWFSVIIKAGKSVTLRGDTIGGNLDGAMALYSGDCGNLTLLACNDDDGPLNQPQIIYTNLTDQDQTYFIRYWSYNNNNFGTFRICAFNSPPKNDECINAITVLHHTTCTNTLATSENATLSLAGCDGIANDDVWFKFTATSTSATIAVDGFANYDAVLEFYTDCTTPFPTSCTDNASPGLPEQYTATNLNIGQTYYYRVYDERGFTTFPSNWRFTTCVYGGILPPVNDECLNATELTHSFNCTAVSGSSENATPSLTGCTGTADDDVWYKFKAESSEAIIEVSPNGDFNPVLAIMSDCNTTMACINDNAGGAAERYHFTGLTIGNYYQFRVYEFRDNNISQPSEWTFNVCVYGVVPDPCSTFNMNITTPLVPTGVYHTYFTLQTIGNVKTISNSSIDFIATSSILLNPDFEVTTGTLFKADIAPCN